MKEAAPLPLPRLHPALVAGCVALAYFVTGRLGLELYIAQGTATLIWAPTGIAIAAILLFGCRASVPGVAAGALAVTLSIGIPLAAALAITVGNALEALVAGCLLRRLVGHDNPFASIGGTLRYILLAAFAATTLSATVGAIATVATGAEPSSTLFRIWLLWWMGDVAGALLLAPVLYLAGRAWLLDQAGRVAAGSDAPATGSPSAADEPVLPGEMRAEFAVVLGLALLSAIALYGGWLSDHLAAHLSWLPLLFLLWAAGRFSLLPAVTISFLIAVTAIGGTLATGSLRGQGAANEELVYLYSFLFAQSVATILAAAFMNERRQLLRELVHAREAAQNASQQKSRFLANMSHEIRTPLNGIIGMTTLLAGEVVEQRQREKLRIIQSSADSLLSILNDILDLARIEAGKLTIVPRPLDLHDVVRDVTGLFQGQAMLKDIALRAIIDGNVPRRIVCDDTRLRQVLANVVSNAVKFTERGRIDLHVSREQAGDNPVVLSFTVTDTGIGMSRDIRERVFDPFVQADDSSSRKRGGTGLGLPISRQLTERMGGAMTLNSTLGVGTEVIVRLPVQLDHSSPAAGNPAGQAPGHAHAPAGSTRRLRLLVAEDNPINAMVITQMLEKLGYDCTLVVNGEEALAHWQDGFSGILLDCQMPLRDGYDTAREIRRQEAGGDRRIPIIALTANAMREERARCLDAGMDDYLAKPVRLDALASMLERHLPH